MSDSVTARLSGALAVPAPAVLGAVVLVVVAVFVWQGVYLFSAWRGDGIDDARLRLRMTGSPDTGMGLEQVAMLHLFGDVASIPPSAPVAAPAEIPKTELKLVLVGAMTDSDPQKASALIEVDKQTRRFYTGDSVSGGVVLQEVRADSVLLKRNGNYEILAFPRAADAATGAASVPSTGIRTVPVAGVRPGGLPGGQPGGIPVRGPSSGGGSAARSVPMGDRQPGMPQGRLPRSERGAANARAAHDS